LREVKGREDRQPENRGKPGNGAGLLDHVRYVESQRKAPSYGMEGGHKRF
jgi:hypothetical protein